MLYENEYEQCVRITRMHTFECSASLLVTVQEDHEKIFMIDTECNEYNQL